MLIIPALHISGGRCVYRGAGAGDDHPYYPADPVAAIRWWRGENAKALHIFDHDARIGGGIDHARLAAMTACVDIAIEYQPAHTRLDDLVAAVRESGVFRIALPLSGDADARAAGRALHELGARKVVAVLDARVLGANGQALYNLLRALRGDGLERCLIAAGGPGERFGEKALATINNFAARTNFSTGVYGFIQNFSDLRFLQRHVPTRVDSVVLDAPLYRNAFPCQRLWRVAEDHLSETHSIRTATRPTDSSLR